MKFKIDRHVLLKPLDQVSKALSSKTTIPILTGILFRVDDEGLTMIACDTTIYIKSTIPADDFELLRAGSIVIPGKKIIEIVKKMGNDISIEVNGRQVTIKSGKSKFELSGLEAEEYPPFPQVPESGIVMPGDKLKSLINKTIFATSKQESNNILTGVLFNFGENKLKLIACDRHRLARVEQDIENKHQAEVAISYESLTELMKLVSGEIELFISHDLFTAKTKDVTFASRVLDGNYPNTEKLIPTGFNSKTLVSRSQLLSALERVFIVAVADSANQIKLTVGEEVEIEAKNQDGQAAESLEIIQQIGDGFKVSLNAKYVMDALNAIEAENVVICFTDRMGPMILKGIGEEGNTQLVLPYSTAD